MTKTINDGFVNVSGVFGDVENVFEESCKSVNGTIDTAAKSLTEAVECSTENSKKAFDAFVVAAKSTMSAQSWSDVSAAQSEFIRSSLNHNISVLNKVNEVATSAVQTALDQLSSLGAYAKNTQKN